jgi:hypothetical protein
MRADDRDRKGPAKKAEHRHERRQDPRRSAQPPRTWTGKTMHHPATRIGEIKHGKG